MERNADRTTRVMFFDEDDLSFAFASCMANSLEGLVPLQLNHTSDVTNISNVLYQFVPHVIVVDQENFNSLMEAITALQRLPIPILVQCSNPKSDLGTFPGQTIVQRPRRSSLGGIHELLLEVVAISRTEYLQAASELAH